MREFGAGGELRPMVALTASEGGARLLSFLFYILAARILAPEGFGTVRYTIALASIAFGWAQLLGLAMRRELGAARGQAGLAAQLLGSGITAAAALLLITIVLYLLAQLAGLTAAANLVGFLVVLSGMSLFEIYYGVARGLGDIRRAGVAYFTGSLVQLAAFGLLAATTAPGPTVTLVVFGASFVVPIAVYELVRPVLRSRGLRISREGMARLRVIGAPLILGQICFLVWNSADQVWVGSQLGAQQVGLYSAARNLSQLFIVLIAGVAGVLLPRVAELHAAGEAARARRLILRATAGLVLISSLLAVAVIAERSFLLTNLYGHAYAGAAPSLIGLAVAMVLFAGFATLGTAAIGWGRPGVWSLGFLVAAATEAVYLVALAGHRPSDAAWALAASSAAALVVICVRLIRRPLA